MSAVARLAQAIDADHGGQLLPIDTEAPPLRARATAPIRGSGYGASTPRGLTPRPDAAPRTFVTDILTSVDIVVISTRLTDTYGRYLADVKYLPDAGPQTVLARGTYLNVQLLDEGLARRYEQ